MDIRSQKWDSKSLLPAATLMAISTLLMMGLSFQGVVASGNETIPTAHTVDSSPIAEIAYIEDPQGSTVYDPQNITIKTGDEILILNNDTTSHTFANGAGPDDPLLGKLFNVEAIQPKGFAEYVSLTSSLGLILSSLHLIQM